MMYWKTGMMGGYESSPFFWGGISILAIWDLAWRGLGMWRAARRKEPWWFVAQLFINSMGLLPIAYLLVWGKDDPDMVKKVKVVKVAKKKKR